MPFVVDETVGYGTSTKYLFHVGRRAFISRNFVFESCDYVIHQAFLEQLNVVDNENEIVAPSLPHVRRL